MMASIPAPVLFLLPMLLLPMMLLGGCAGRTPATAGPPPIDYGQLHAERAADRLVGTAAPAVQLTMLDGSSRSLRAGPAPRPVYLKFWATWCQPCVEQMPHLQRTFDTHGAEMDIIAVNVGVNDSVERAQALVSRLGLTMPVAIDRDGSAALAFDLSVTPQHVVIGADGVVRFVGHHADAALDAAIKAAVEAGGGAPSAPTAGAPARVPPAGLVDDTGAAVDLGGQSGLMVVTFAAAWADWYLLEGHPAAAAAAVTGLRAVEQAKASQTEARWLTVLSPIWTTADDLPDLRRRLGVTGPVAIDWDSSWFQRFGARELPLTIILRDGLEVARVPAGGDVGAAVRAATTH